MNSPKIKINPLHMDEILKEIEDIRKLLSTTKSENLRESLQKRLKELEKKLEELRKEEEKKKKKETRKKIKLHAIRKFKIDQEKILEWFSREKRTIGRFFDVLCKEIVKYPPISPLGLIKTFQKYKPQLKFLEIKKISNKST
jgi:alanyl-tRNA synthetase